MSDITLSAGVRSNLLSLQGTASLLDRTQERLSTGKKVNGPLDDAAAFFTARGLSGRANDLSSIMQGMQNGMKTIDAASKGLSSITTTMENLVGTVRQALGDPGGVSRESTAITIADADFGTNEITINGETFDLGALNYDSDTDINTAAERANAFVNTINTNADARAAGVSAKINPDDADQIILVNESGQDVSFDAGGAWGGATPLTAPDTAEMSDTRRSLMNNFNDLRNELNQLSQDSGYNGNNLLQSDVLEVVFNELTGDQRTSFTVNTRQADGTAFGDVEADRLGAIEADADMFGSSARLEERLQALQNGIGELRSLSAQMGTAQTIIENREGFTKEMVNTLQAGSDGLTLADMNEEAANNLAMQTRQQLGQSALSLAIQNDQSVLQLLR
ncbi:MAG: putative hook-associated protein [Saliniramus fredricksonii]|uniref:Flagellin n=1 Tax=Saliniramus fredricksonii TaxID=1653334 RepID=A0A0P7X6Q4_9HYPH|nr:flagellin [Saliniramus fredricksonii]KPQ10703.1 MAG: putative hook-associated protein [Saliniramus fredricksonii]SCC79592.1 Flagellin FlgL [Saliniramus fredricksonii]